MRVVRQSALCPVCGLRSLALAAALASLLPAAACGVSRLPPGAYLRLPARSAASLLRQVRADRLVAGRYARIFQVTPAVALLAFARLRLVRLDRDRVLRVYYVHPGECIGYRVRRVKKGTKVFALPDGTPLLAQVCGNPLRATLPTPRPTALYTPVAVAPDFDPQEPLPADVFEDTEAEPARALPAGVRAGPRRQRIACAERLVAAWSRTPDVPGPPPRGTGPLAFADPPAPGDPPPYPRPDRPGLRPFPTRPGGGEALPEPGAMVMALAALLGGGLARRRALSAGIMKGWRTSLPGCAPSSSISTARSSRRT